MVREKEIGAPLTTDKVYQASRLRYRTRLMKWSTGNFYRDMLSVCRRNPVVGAVIDLYSLGLRRLAPTYTNDNPQILEFVTKHLKDKHSIASVSARMAMAPVSGFGIGRFVPCAMRDGTWGIGSIDNLWYTDFDFKRDIATRELVGIELNDEMGRVYPMELVIHIIAGEHLAFGDPCGVGSFERVVSIAEAWSLLMDDMVTAGRRQATPALYARAKEGRSPILDVNGNPMTSDGMPATQDNVTMARIELQSMTKNGDVLAVPNTTDLGVLAQQTDGRFFDTTIRLCMQLAFIAMLSPETILAARSGSLGDSGVSEQHAQTLENLILPFAQLCGEEMLKKVIKPLIFWNFGEQEDYGKMEPIKSDDPDRIALLQLLAQHVQDAFSDPRLNDKVLDLIRV